MEDTADSTVKAPSHEQARRPTVRILPPRWRVVPDGTELWRFRGLLLTLAVRDITLRYRQTLLGVVWVVLQPLLGAAIFAVVFGRVAGLSTNGSQRYFLVSYVGMLGWMLFSSTLAKAGGSLVGNAQLVSKVYFPRLILPLSGVLSAIIDFGVGLLLLAAILYWSPEKPGLSLLTLPLWVALLACQSVGFGLVAAALAVRYRDVQYILPVLIQYALYASPVAYKLDDVPVNLRTFFALNPLSGALEGLRWCLLGVGHLDWSATFYACSASVLMLLVGIAVFQGMERRVADVI